MVITSTVKLFLDDLVVFIRNPSTAEQIKCVCAECEGHLKPWFEAANKDVSINRIQMDVQAILEGILEELFAPSTGGPTDSIQEALDKVIRRLRGLARRRGLCVTVKTFSPQEVAERMEYVQFIIGAIVLHAQL
jgi:hypothetical protein